MKKDIFYKTQINNFSDIAETLKVVEKSAAANIHFLKKKKEVLQTYKNQIQTMLYRLSHFYWADDHPLLKQRAKGKTALLVLTSNKGMVGGLYHELINEFLARKNNYEYVWVLGSQGKEYLSQEHIQAKDPFANLSFEGLPTNESINKITAYLFQQFQEFKFKKIDVLYPKFLSLVEQKPDIIQFLPFKFARANTMALTDKQDKPSANVISKNNEGEGFPIFEPSKKMVFDTLIKKYINVALAELIWEAKLSEFSARTITAESGVKKTEDLIHLFKKRFLKARHLSITQKQLESFSVHQLI